MGGLVVLLHCGHVVPKSKQTLYSYTQQTNKQTNKRVYTCRQLAFPHHMPEKDDHNQVVVVVSPLSPHGKESAVPLL